VGGTGARSHADYLDKIRCGRLSPGELAQLEIPASPDVVDWFRLMAGGTPWPRVPSRRTPQAAERRRRTLPRRSLRGPGGRRASGGGFHHAFGNHGEGFCMINDVAVAIRAIKRDRLVSRVAVVDCDVHQANGTAMIRGRPLGLHVLDAPENNYPGYKPKSALDVGLADGAGTTSTEALSSALPKVLVGGPE
jgi:hypothetical protein